MIKEAVNQTQDHHGFYTSLNAAFTLHELNHAHWSAMSGGATLVQTPDLGGPSWKDAPSIRPAERSRP